MHRFSALIFMLILTSPASAADVTDCIKAQQARQQGQFDAAIQLYTSCIDMGELTGRQLSMALNNRGNAHLDADQYNQAIADFDEAINVNPEYAKPYNNRGLAKQLKGLYSDAIIDYKQAVKRDPVDLNALNNLAWIQATCPVATIRNGVEALKIALLVNEATEFGNAATLDTLAAAYAETGNFEQAINYQRQALGLADGVERVDQEKRLAQYRNNIPFRDLTGL